MLTLSRNSGITCSLHVFFLASGMIHGANKSTFDYYHRCYLTTCTPKPTHWFTYGMVYSWEYVELIVRHVTNSSLHIVAPPLPSTILPTHTSKLSEQILYALLFKKSLIWIKARDESSFINMEELLCCILHTSQIMPWVKSEVSPYFSLLTGTPSRKHWSQQTLESAHYSRWP